MVTYLIFVLCTLEHSPHVRYLVSFLVQEPEKQKQSPVTEHRSETTTSSAESQPAAPVSASDRLKPVTFDKRADSASPERQRDRTDSETEKKPVEQESERDAVTCTQQPGSREADPAPAVTAAEPGVTRKQGSSDGEEKRDQSKEEPPLEIKQQEGQWRRFWGWITSHIFVYIIV